MNTFYDCIVIGSGPAGMMAAIRAGERGKQVLLIERNNELGKKLLITGGGRCNLTNIHDSAYFLEKFFNKGDFLRNAFAQYFNTDILDFFQNAGLKFKEEDNGCIFPETNNAEDIISILKQKLFDNNVKIIFGERIRNIMIEDNKIKGITAYSGKEYYAPHLLVATGGASYPQTGSTGDGYELAKEMNHSVVLCKPALVPVEIKEDFIKKWQGISLTNIKVSVLRENKKVIELRGDIIFTHFGLSGPVILDISADVYDMVQTKIDAIMSINFQPDLDYKKINEIFIKEIQKSPNKQLKNILDILLPKNMTEQFLKYCNVDYNKKAHQLMADERKTLISHMLDFRLTIKGVRPISEATITRGGISTNEINPKTMESKLIKGLFFAGEVIDIDAKTGGYNLQAAFSTGWVAGNNL